MAWGGLGWWGLVAAEERHFGGGGGFGVCEWWVFWSDGLEEGSLAI